MLFCYVNVMAVPISNLTSTQKANKKRQRNNIEGFPIWTLLLLENEITRGSIHSELARFKPWAGSGLLTKESAINYFNNN